MEKKLNKRKGSQSLEFTNPPVILSTACVVGKKQG